MKKRDFKFRRMAAELNYRIVLTLVILVLDLLLPPLSLMAIRLKFSDISHTFKNLYRSRFFEFHLSNETPCSYLLHTHLRIAVLDSPFKSAITAAVHSVAVMLVPILRENDWIFVTEEGHRQLLFDNPQFSRFILIGNLPSSETPTSYFRPNPNITYEQLDYLERFLTPLVTKLCPTSAFENGSPRITFLTYDKDDDVICRLIWKEKGSWVGDNVGAMLIENVHIDTSLNLNSNGRQFRRRLTFKQTPNVIQTDLALVPSVPIENPTYAELLKIKFLPDTCVLVQPYLTAMVAGLSMIASNLDKRIQHGYKPRALCLGVGGGALLSFLTDTLDFEVIGVEVDTTVLWVARQFFGLKLGPFLRLIVGDGIQLIEELELKVGEEFIRLSSDFMEQKDDQKTIRVKWIDAKFDVIMVDLVSDDGSFPVTAPPEEFFERSVFRAAKAVLREGGILIINVLPPKYQSFYDTLVKKLREFFPEVYKSVVKGEANLVLIAAAESIETVNDERVSSFSKRLRSVISLDYLDSMEKI